MTGALDAQILAAVRHTPVSAQRLASTLADHIQPVARAAGARPTDVLAQHLLQLNDAGRIRYLAKAEGWVQVRG
tara:strand:- start:179 stop:400 length:222 start_codon:yes stop_codon:yes gene_type:complete